MTMTNHDADRPTRPAVVLLVQRRSNSKYSRLIPLDFCNVPYKKHCHSSITMLDLRQRLRFPIFWSAVLLVVSCGLLLFVLLSASDDSSSVKKSSAKTHSATNRRLSIPSDEERVKVFGYRDDDNPISQKQQNDLMLQSSSNALSIEQRSGDVLHQQETEPSSLEFEPVFLTLDEQRDYIQTHCPQALQKFSDFRTERPQVHLAVEIWKFCALSQKGGVYIDSSSPLLTRLSSIVSDFTTTNVAVLGQSYLPQTIHGSILVLTPNNAQVAQHLLQLLVHSDVHLLEANPLLIPRTLYAYIATQVSSKELKHGIMGSETHRWSLLEQFCHLNPLKRSSSVTPSSHSSSSSGWLESNSYLLAHHCPIKAGFCCSIFDSQPQLVMITQHPILPYQIIPETDILQPYNAKAGHYDKDELPYISTLREQVFVKPDDYPSTPNFFDTLLRNKCLPDDDKCSRCLREKTGADCRTCAQSCPCYCKALCHEIVEPKFVSKHLTVTPPLFRRDPNRLIPRIVHQTWFETITPDKYPNFSRLVESFRRSGWEYKFYSDDDALNFLSTHFPVEVRDAYAALRPGAFKADLFRYCVLLIHGGVYADVDILLESNLDHSVAPDVGFMVPMDEVGAVTQHSTIFKKPAGMLTSLLLSRLLRQPGKPVNRRMCLWNGFIAAAPGHPFLIKAIETVVNQVRNRFTAVDTDAAFCPNPELSILHAFDVLFTAGPCLLGSSINRVLGRNPQTGFAAGEISIGPRLDNSHTGSSFVLGLDDAPARRIPGRTIILGQNKWDMGAHRFTWQQRNLVVAATDLPDSNDRENLKDKHGSGGGGEHYSKTHAKTGVYGLDGLYTDKTQANEDIRIFVDASRATYDPLLGGLTAAA